MEVLFHLFAWLQGLPQHDGSVRRDDAARFRSVPVVLDEDTFRHSVDTLCARVENSDITEWSRNMSEILSSTVAHVIDQFEGAEGTNDQPACANSAAMLRELGLERTALANLWQRLAYRLGPISILLDGIRELPETQFRGHEEALASNMLQLARGPEESSARVVLFWRGEASEPGFSQQFLQVLREKHRAESRISELKEIGDTSVKEYLGLALAQKGQVLDHLTQAIDLSPELRQQFTSDLRLLPAAASLEQENFTYPVWVSKPDHAATYSRNPDHESLMKVAIDRRREAGMNGGGSYVEQPVWRLYAGQILRWAFVSDYHKAFEADERNRLTEADALDRVLDYGREEGSELIALGLLAFLATASGRGRGQLSIKQEVAPILQSVFGLAGAGNYVWRGHKRGNQPARSSMVMSVCASELERLTGRVWIKGSEQDYMQSTLDFRHEQDRVLAVVWLLDYVLAHPADPRLELTIPASGTNGSHVRRLAGPELRRYAFALESLSPAEQVERRTAWEPIHRLFEEASNEAWRLFELDEVKRHIKSGPGPNTSG